MCDHRRKSIEIVGGLNHYKQNIKVLGYDGTFRKPLRTLRSRLLIMGMGANKASILICTLLNLFILYNKEIHTTFLGFSSPTSTVST